jgi:hypothetical protein
MLRFLKSLQNLKGLYVKDVQLLKKEVKFLKCLCFKIVSIFLKIFYILKMQKGKERTDIKETKDKEKI